jgi:hypothetical protein
MRLGVLTVLPHFHAKDTRADRSKAARRVARRLNLP